MTLKFRRISACSRENYDPKTRSSAREKKLWPKNSEQSTRKKIMTHSCPRWCEKKIYDPKTAAWLCDTERRGTFSGPAGQFGEDFSSMRGWFLGFSDPVGGILHFSGPAGLCFSRLWTPQRHFLQIPIARSLKAPNCTIAKRSKDTHAKKNDPFHILGRNVQKHAKKNYDP